MVLCSEEALFNPGTGLSSKLTTQTQTEIFPDTPQTQEGTIEGQNTRSGHREWQRKARNGWTVGKEGGDGRSRKSARFMTP